MYKFPIKKVFQGLTTAESRNDSFCCWDYSLSSSTLETAGLKFTNQHLLNKTNKKYISSEIFSLYEGSCFWLFLWRGSKRRRNNLATWRVVSSPSSKMKVILVICSVTGSFWKFDERAHLWSRCRSCGIIPIVSASFCPLLRPPTVPHRKVKPGNYSMHLSKLLNKHKTIETRALDVNSSLLEMDANKPNDDYKNGYKTQISTQVGNMDVVKKVKQQLLGDWSSRRRDGNVGQSETFGPNWNV